jgi:hypothetical protein
MVKPHELITAHNHNVQYNQIGLYDGVNPDVMADLGFETPDRTLEILANMGKVASAEVAPDVKKAPAVCGDCGKPFPCQHGNGRRTFGK